MTGRTFKEVAGQPTARAGIAGPDIDGERLLRRLRALAQIGRDENGGITRPGFSPADREAQLFLRHEAAQAGLVSRVDPAGNLHIHAPRGPEERPALMIGSHLDTVVNGGWLDGAYGVVAALEVVQVLAAAGVSRPFDVTAIAFANEEGALFPFAFWGSSALAGPATRLPRDLCDVNGASLAPALAAAGGDISRLEEAVTPPGSVLAYLELHIEQGPVLEAHGIDIGTVDSIGGRTLLEVSIEGRAAHAGTTPMAGRNDALAAAAELTLAVERLSADEDVCRVSTVGWMAVQPNSPNTIAGSVTMTVDLRDHEARAAGLGRKGSAPAR